MSSSVRVHVRRQRRIAAAVLAAIAVAATLGLGDRTLHWNDELEITSPLAGAQPPVDDPRTPRLTDRVVLVLVDGLGADESELPFLDELRARGTSNVARVPYPSISRANYVTIMTGVPPRDSGVRTNRVHAPVAVDSVFARVTAAGLHAAAASDYGILASLFVTGAPSIMSIEWHEYATHVTPPAAITWPLDEVRRAPSLAELGPVLADLLRGDAAFISVLALDVDRAGHAAGVGAEYRAAARDVDRMLRAALADLDLSRATVLVTADHGHVAPGGHGGVEDEVTRVPLVLAGAGIVPGAHARDARLVDVAPTVAALLGIPSPRSAEGRTLVELLQLPADAAARRRAADDAHVRAVTATVDAAHAARTEPEPWRLVVIVVVALAGVLLLRAAARRGVVAIPRASPVGAIAVVTMLGAMAIVTRGRLSPSYVPALARTELLVAIAIVISLALQLALSAVVVRRAADRLAAANGLAAIALAIAFGAVALAHAWFSPPYLDVPPPLWFVALPALDLAAATCAFGTALTLAFALRADTR